MYMIMQRWCEEDMFKCKKKYWIHSFNIEGFSKPNCQIFLKVANKILPKTLTSLSSIRCAAVILVSCWLWWKPFSNSSYLVGGLEPRSEQLWTGSFSTRSRSRSRTRWQFEVKMEGQEPLLDKEQQTTEEQLFFCLEKMKLLVVDIFSWKTH